MESGPNTIYLAGTDGMEGGDCRFKRENFLTDDPRIILTALKYQGGGFEIGREGIGWYLL